MKSNKMLVNGKEEEWTDAQMRDWYEDHCTALTQTLYNRNNTLRKLSKEYRDLQKAHADLQQICTDDMLRNGKLSEWLKGIDDEEK